MNRLLISAGLLSLVMATGAAFAGYKLAPGPNHMHARELALQSQLNQVSDFQVLFLGDSIVERADLRRACSASTLNAGVSGATVSDVLKLTRSLKMDRVDRVVIAVGINDAKKGARAPVYRVMADYSALIDVASSAGANVTLATVAPTGSAGLGEYDQAYIARFNAELIALASKRNIEVVDLSVLGSDNGLLPDAYVLDGVHFTGNGYRAWLAPIVGYCS